MQDDRHHWEEQNNEELKISIGIDIRWFLFLFHFFPALVHTYVKAAMTLLWDTLTPWVYA